MQVKYLLHKRLSYLSAFLMVSKTRSKSAITEWLSFTRYTRMTASDSCCFTRLTRWYSTICTTSTCCSLSSTDAPLSFSAICWSHNLISLMLERHLCVYLKGGFPGWTISFTIARRSALSCSSSLMSTESWRIKQMQSRTHLRCWWNRMIEFVRAGCPEASLSRCASKKTRAASSSSRSNSSASWRAPCWNSSLIVYSSPETSSLPIIL